MTASPMYIGMWQRKVERGAAIDRTFRPGAAAVALYDPTDIRQSDPGTLEFIGAVESLKDTEQLVRVLHIEADPIVADEYDHFVWLVDGPDFDLGSLPRRRILNGVRQQIDEHQAHHVRVGLHDRQFADAPDDLSAVDRRRDLLPRVADKRCQVDTRPDETRTAGSRKGQQVVDELPHPRRRIDD